MGMTYVLRRATPEQLALLGRQPQLITRFLFDEPREAAAEATGLMGQLRDQFKFSAPGRPIGGRRVEGDEIDLDKSWHLIHFLLTGSGDCTDDVTSFLVGDWPEIGDIEVGWGRAWAIDAEAVRRFDDALRDTQDDRLCARFDTQQMEVEDVYLADAFEGDEPAGCNYVLHHLAVLRRFVAEAARRGCGAVGYLA